MDDLGDQKGKNTNSCSIVGGEEDVSNRGGKKGEMKEVVFGELSDCINEAEKDTADPNEHQDGAIWFDESQDDVCQINPDPDCRPMCWKKSAKGGWGV